MKFKGPERWRKVCKSLWRRREYCGVYKYESENVTYYFLDNEKYFKRDKSYGYMDDGERFAFFSRAILEIIPHIDFKPDIECYE